VTSARERTIAVTQSGSGLNEEKVAAPPTPGELADHLKELDGEIRKKIAFFCNQAGFNKFCYNALRAIVIVLSVTVPALVQAGCKRSAVVLSVIVAAVAGIEGFWKPGQVYRNQKAAELALYALLQRMDASKIQLRINGKWSAQNLANLYTAISSTYTQICQQEAWQYVTMHISSESAAGQPQASGENAASGGTTNG
jgi:hypothetical protein